MHVRPPFDPRSPVARDPATGANRPARRRVPALLALYLAAYTVFLALNIGPFAGGADTSGYFNHARLLADGQFRYQPPMLALPGVAEVPIYTFCPLGFRPLTFDSLMPTYPLGLPLGLAAVSGVFGWTLGPAILLIGHALAGIVVLYALGKRLGLSDAVAFAATVVFSASPLTLHMSLHMMSDLPTTVWSMLAIYAALRSREATTWAWGAGLATSVAILLRQNNAPLLLPIALLTGGHLGRALRVIIGGLPALITLLVVNHRELGSPFDNGYGNMSYLFSTAHVPITLAHYARWLPQLYPASLGLAFAAPLMDRRLWFLAAWAIGPLALYAFYWHTHETWWFLRFVLPAVPPLILGAAWVLQRLWCGVRTTRWRRPVMIATALSLLAPGVTYARHSVIKVGRTEGRYREGIGWIQTHVDPRAVIFAMQCSGALTYYADYTLVRWDMITPETFAAVRRQAAIENRPIYALLFPFEVDPALKDKIAGPWELEHQFHAISLWRLSDGHSGTP